MSTCLYSQVYKIPVPNVRFGSGVPVAMSTDKENDTYIRTDDGLYTGTFLEEYVFDKNYGAWILCTLSSSPVGVSSLTTDYVDGVLTTTIDGVVYDTAQIPTSGGGGSDDQKIDTFTIVSNTLRLSLESDAEAYKSVSLSPYLDNTDSQTIDTFSYSSDTLRLSLSGDGQLYNKIYIPQITDTDNQTIDTFDIAANVLRISLQDDAQAFKSVNLSTYLDNTDAQTLTWTSGTGNLDISGGNTVNLDGRYLLSEVDGSTTNEIQTIDTFSYASKNVKLSLLNDGVASSNLYLGQFLDTTTTHSGDVSGIYSNLQLGASTVTSTEIGNGEVSTLDLADSVITEVKLISNSVGTTALKTGSVSTLKLADSSVTAIKVISNSIDSIQLKSTGVTAGNYTSANIYVDIDGRIISASNGSGGSSPNVITPSQITSDQNDYSPTGFGDATLVRISGDNGIRAITSLAAQTDGEEKTFVNIGSYPVYFSGEDSSGTAANRISTNRDMFLYPLESAILIYDGTTSRWLINKINNLENAKEIKFISSFGSASSGDYGEVAFGNFGTGTTTTPASNSTQFGGISLNSNSSSTGGAYIYHGKSIATYSYFGSAHIYTQMNVIFPTLSDATNTYTYECIITTSPTSSSVSPNNTVGIRYSSGINSGKFQGYSRSNSGSETVVDLGVKVAAATIYTLRVEINKARNTARFYINGIAKGLVTGNMPNAGAAGTRNAFLESAGTAARSAVVQTMISGAIYP